MSEINSKNFQTFGDDITLYPGQRVVKIGDKMFPIGIGNSVMPIKPPSYYKCANVYGPYEVETVVISGCPTAAVNGEYLPTENRTTDWEGNSHVVYANSNGYYYYFEATNWMSWGVGTDYTKDLAYQGTVGGSWMNPNDWMTVEGMTAANGTAMADADVPKTWDGYKAVQINGVYTFETSLTTGLTYSGEKLQKNCIYNSDATVKADWLSDGTIWSKDLAFYAPLTSDLEYSETGQNLGNKGVTIGEADGITAAYFNGGNTGMIPFYCNGLPQGNMPYTVMVDIYPTEAGYSTVLQGRSSGHLKIFINNNPTRLWLNFADKSCELSIDVLNKWSTVVLTRDAKGNLTMMLGKMIIYSATKATASVSFPEFYIGVRGSDRGEAYRGYMKNIRFYPRSFSYSELCDYVDRYGSAGPIVVPGGHQRILYWNMDDTGDSAVDSVYGLSLSKVNTVTSGVAGVTGTCWEVPTDSGGWLAGTNDKVALPQKFTLNFAVNLSNTTSGCLIDFGGFDSNSGFGVWYNGNSLAPRIAQSYNNYGTPISTGAWHWVTFTYDGSTMKMYLDGTHTQSVGYSGAISYNSAVKFFMRGDKDGEGQTYGKLDEISLYNYAMTGGEVAALN